MRAHIWDAKSKFNICARLWLRRSAFGPGVCPRARGVQIAGKCDTRANVGSILCQRQGRWHSIAPTLAHIQWWLNCHTHPLVHCCLFCYCCCCSSCWYWYILLVPMLLLLMLLMMLMLLLLLRLLLILLLLLLLLLLMFDDYSPQ